MNKKRGLKRYFKSIQSRQLVIPSTWVKDQYFSYDKIWVDYIGFKAINKRKHHLDCLIRNFDSLAEQSFKLNKQFQIWIFINEDNSKEDCIILHSPNPFTSFPHQYQNLSIDHNFKNSGLSDYLNQKADFKKLFGISIHENQKGNSVKENFCVLFKDQVGVSVG
ncbi:MAG: hypothetical protein ACOVP1_09105 [Bacteroidia bacterium]